MKEKTKNNKIFNFIEKHEQGFFLTIVLIFCSIYYISYTIHNIPYTQGWGNSYADLVFSGKFPYRDFYFYLPPLNLIIDCIFWKLSFGHLMIYVLFRLIERMVIIWLIYKLLCKLTKSRYASICTILGAFLLSATFYDVIGDYNQTTLLLTVILTNIYTKYIEIANKMEFEKREYKYLFFGGLIIGLSFLHKQTLFLAQCIVFFIVLTTYFIINHKKQYIKSILITLTGIIIPVAIALFILAINGAAFQFLDQVYLNVDSKGSIASMLISIFLICSKWEYLILSIALTIYICCSKQFIKLKKANKEKEELILYILMPIIIFALVLSVYINKNLQNIFIDIFLKLTDFLIIITISSILLICYLCYLYSKNKDINLLKWIIALSGGLAFEYNTTMASQPELANYGATLLCAILIAYLLSEVCNKDRIMKVIILIICIFIPGTCMAQKGISAYVWWGWQESRMDTSKFYNIDVPGLEGYRTSLNVKCMYEEMYKVIKNNTNQESVIFGFPHVRIFNVLLNNSNMNHFVPVPFYDVCSEDYMREDIKKLKENPPEIIVWCDIPRCMELHEELFRDGKPLEQRKFQEWLCECVDNGKYKLIGQYESLFIYKLNDGTEINYTYYKDKDAINYTLVSK